MRLLRTLLALFVILFCAALPTFAQDAVPMNTVILNTVQDVHDWPVTTKLTSLATGTTGIEAQFSKREAGWPDITPAGWEGPIYYTVWLGTRLSDGVHLAASLNVYRGQQGAGAGDVTHLDQYSKNLWYLDAALKAHVTADGETLYLMVTAGGQRGVEAISVRERSNIVAFTASTSPKTFTYGEPAPVPDPTPVPVPSPDLGPLNERINALTDRVAVLELAVSSAITSFEARVVGLEGRVAVVEARPIPATCKASIFGIGVSCSLQ